MTMEDFMKVVIDEFAGCADTKLLTLDVPAINLAGVGFTPPQEVADYFVNLFNQINRGAICGRQGIRSNLCVIEYKDPAQRESPELSFSLKLDGFKVDVVTRDKGDLGFVLERSHANDPAFHRETIRDAVGNERFVYVRSAEG
jgi:hypothetical protein